jgi:hypothetical protein
MRQLFVEFDQVEIEELLAKYNYEMFNKANKYEGEITVLDSVDVNAIVSDMKFDSQITCTINENGMVTVEYPYNVCKLESRDLIN